MFAENSEIRRKFAKTLKNHKIAEKSKYRRKFQKSPKTTGNPEYYKLGDHTETVQIVYDPTRISYEDLLNVFWHSHNPTMDMMSVQYKSIIFYHNDEQKQIATESKEQLEAEKRSRIFTEIVPAPEFYPAEGYHQKYYLQQVEELAKEFKAKYPDINDFTNSTAVARVNGYVAGYGMV